MGNGKGILQAIEMLIRATVRMVVHLETNAERCIGQTRRHRTSC